MTPDERTSIANFEQALANFPDNWDLRKQLASLLFNVQDFTQAAEVLWNAPEIPSTVDSIAFTVRVLAKAHPRRALRLLTMTLELTRHKPENVMALAENLMAEGMVLEATRCYGAATAADPSLADEDFESWLLWTDHHQRLWNDFEKAQIKLGDVPWLNVDPHREQRVARAASEEIDGIMFDQVAVSEADERPLAPQTGVFPTEPPALNTVIAARTESSMVPVKDEALASRVGNLPPVMPPPSFNSAPPPPSLPAPSLPAAMAPPSMAGAIPPPSAPRPMPPLPTPAIPGGVSPLTGGVNPLTGPQKKLRFAFPKPGDSMKTV